MTVDAGPDVLLNGLKAWFSVMNIKDPGPEQWKQFLEYTEVIPVIETDGDYLHYLSQLNVAEWNMIERVASGAVRSAKGNETSDPSYIWYTVLVIKLMCFELNTGRSDYVRTRYSKMLDAVRAEGAAASVPFTEVPKLSVAPTELAM